MILTAWENALLHMDIDDYLDLEGCACEGLCVCEDTSVTRLT